MNDTPDPIESRLRETRDESRIATLKEALDLTRKYGASDAYRHALQDLIYMEESLAKSV